MKKKLLSLALALVMCLGLTVPAFAAENPEDWWKNAKEVKNFDEFLAAVLDEKVEEIKIVGEVTIPKPVEYPLTVETPVLVGKEGKLTMAPDSTMYVHVPVGRFSFEDRENTWDHVAEMCETFIMWRIAGNPEAEAEVSFTGIDREADYAGAVAWAVENGITTGTSETTFSPMNTCTRGQIVTFLYRANQAAQ